MTGSSKARIIVTFLDTGLNDDDLQDAARNLVDQIVEDDLAEASLVKDTEIKAGQKSIGGFLIDMLQAEVTPANILRLLHFLGDGLLGGVIEIEVKLPSGAEVKLKARSRAELQAAIEASQQLLLPPE